MVDEGVLSRKSSPRSCGLAVVIVEHSAEARSTAESSRRGRGRGLFLDQPPSKPLMKVLAMVVGHEFLDDVPKMALAEKDENFEASRPPTRSGHQGSS